MPGILPCGRGNHKKHKGARGAPIRNEELGIRNWEREGWRPVERGERHIVILIENGPRMGTDREIAAKDRNRASQCYHALPHEAPHGTAQVKKCAKNDLIERGVSNPLFQGNGGSASRRDRQECPPLLWGRRAVGA